MTLYFAITCGPISMILFTPVSAIVVFNSLLMQPIASLTPSSPRRRGRKYRRGRSCSSCAERERAHHVLARAHAAVEHHLDLVADRARDFRKLRDRGGRAVELPPAMVGNDDRIGAVLRRELGVGCLQDALQNQRAFPGAADPFHVGPVQRRIELVLNPYAERARLSTPSTSLDDVAEGAALAPSTLTIQRGFVMMSIKLGIFIFGGTDSPFLMSWWRWPITCRSTVSTSAEHFAAAARSIRRDEFAVAHDVKLKPERRFDFLATSSMEQTDIVLRQNGMPAFSAARAARISPLPRCMPQSPTGASESGAAAALPRIFVAVERFATSTRIFCRNLIAAKSRGSRQASPGRKSRLPRNR